MKQLQIVDGIKNRYLKIDRALKRVIKNFAEKDIHLFRLEVKKLRSFLRLASVAKGKSSSLKLPKKLHSFYNAIGVIRNLQLQKQSIEELKSVEYSIFQEPYLNFIKNEIDERTVSASKKVNCKKPFGGGRRKLLKRSPDELKQKSIQKFTREKLKALSKLMQPSSLSDEALHAVRKILKDILYTWSFTKERTTLPSIVTLSKEEINTIIEMLGEFQDQCVGLDLLHKHYKPQQTEPNVREAWRNLENTWWREKEIKRKAIHTLFHKQFTLSLTESSRHDEPISMESIKMNGAK